MILDNKNVYIVNKGKISDDFEYIFPEIEISGYSDLVLDKKIVADDQAHLIVCALKETYIDRMLKEQGFELGKNCEYVWDVIKALDFDILNAAGNREIFMCLDDDVDETEYKDICSSYHVSSIIHVKDLRQTDAKKAFVIVDGFMYEKSSVLKESNFVFEHDYISLECLKFMEKYPASRLIEETMKAPMLSMAFCNDPFIVAQINPQGKVFGCCPGWPKWHFGNLKYQNCDEIWNSVYARIFRCSIINRTFVFCKHNSCPKINPSSFKSGEYIRYRERKTDKPKSMQIAIDPTCNLKCESCRKEGKTLSTEEKRDADMMADKILESGWIEPEFEMVLAGSGEVFLSSIYRKLLYGHDEKCRIRILSNGMLLTPDEFEKLSSRYDRLFINISVDAAEKLTYEKLRRGGNWEVLLNNLEYLGNQKAKGRIWKYELNYTVQKDNYSQLIDFVKLSKRLNVDSIVIRPIYNWGTYTEEEFKNVMVVDFNNNKICDELLEIFKDPIFMDPKVYLEWFDKRINK